MGDVSQTSSIFDLTRCEVGAFHAEVLVAFSCLGAFAPHTGPVPVASKPLPTDCVFCAGVTGHSLADQNSA